ncbi:MAG: peptidylprolyl isomerase [Proteobacteria bacterium]|nr:peptidylprolyl isomerase [Pseudomonadota bacterium]
MRICLIFLAMACGSPEPSAPAPASNVVEEAPAEPTALWPSPGAATDARYAASHIVLAYAGAARAPESFGRSEAEAQKLAGELYEQLKAGSDFTELAKTHSDSPSAARGGRVGTYLTGTMMPEFESAVAGIEPGEYTVAQTAFGWHVIRRDVVEHVEAQHIVVGYAGAHESTATRTVEEARAIIALAAERLDAGESFDAVARELSEDPSAENGGHLRGFGRGQMLPAFEEVAFALSAGETSHSVTTPYGVHLIRRLE